MNSLNTKDPYILLSILNMKLRDSYASLEMLCEDYNENKEDIINRMHAIGYTYNEESNQFI